MALAVAKAELLQMQVLGMHHLTLLHVVLRKGWASELKLVASLGRRIFYIVNKAMDVDVAKHALPIEVIGHRY